MSGKEFSLPGETGDAFQNHVSETSISEKNCFKNLFKWVENCINLKNKYFEKQ